MSTRTSAPSVRTSDAGVSVFTSVFAASVSVGGGLSSSPQPAAMTATVRAMSQTQMSLTRAMSISSLADNIGELRVQDKERKVNLLSFDRFHLYSDAARLVVDAPTMNGRAVLPRFVRAMARRNIAKFAGKNRQIAIDESRWRNAVERGALPTVSPRVTSQRVCWTDFARGGACYFFFRDATADQLGPIRAVMARRAERSRYRCAIAGDRAQRRSATATPSRVG